MSQSLSSSGSSAPDTAPPPRTAFSIALSALALLYAFFTAVNLAGARYAGGQALPRWMAAVTAAATVFFLLLTLNVRKRHYDQREENLWIGISFLVILTAIAVSYAVAPSGWIVDQFVYLILGLGAIVSTRRWYLLLMGTTFGALVVGTIVGIGIAEADWLGIAGTTAIGSLVSYFLFTVRRASIQRVQALSIIADKKRVAAEEALLSARRAKSDLQQLIEKAPDAVLILIDGTIRYANQIFLKSLRLGEGDVLGSALEALSVDTIGEAGSSRLGFTRADGERVIFEFSEATNIVHEGQEALLLIGRDVSIADSDLQAKLQIADRMAAIGVLASGVAHEINNPIAYVLGNLSTLDDETETFAQDMPPKLRAEFIELVADSLHGARRVSDIVRDLNSMARTDSGICETDVAVALESSIRIARPHLTHNANLLVKIDQVPPVASNPARLSQIFLNLIINAVQALDGNKDDNNISIRCTEGSHSAEVLVEISDTGSGMSEETQRRLFEPFYTTKAVGEGTGLGLYYCMNELEKIGGELSFTSKVGSGTRFRITLPISEMGRESTGSIATSVPASRSPVGLNILIIDDDPRVCRTLERLLRGNQCTVCSSAKQGLTVLLAGDFDAVFCDLMMPKMTGDVLYAKAEESRPGLGKRFLFITGGAFTPEIQGFINSVPGQVLMKPFQRGTLHRSLYELSKRNAAEVATP